MQTSFDPSGALRFDLPHGSVQTSNDEAVAFIPIEALNELTKTAAREAVEALGHRVGAAIGRRIVARAGSVEEVRAASIEAFITQLAGELAIGGYGAASIERWGKAMIIVVEGAALADHLLAALIDAAVETATGREVWCTPLMRDGGTARFLMSSESAVVQVREWIDGGMSWGEALSRLHRRHEEGA